MAEYPSGFPFADSSDLQNRWASMPDLPEDYVNLILEDISQFILDLYPRVQKTVSERTLTRIACAIAKRALETPDDLVAVESYQQGAGPYQETVKPANPHGDFYLTKMEKRILSGSSGSAWSIDLLAGDHAY